MRTTQSLPSMGRVAPDEYASAVLASQCFIAGVFGVKTKDYNEAFRSGREHAWTAAEYLPLYS